MITAFPLAWPDGWPRSKTRRSSSYKVTTDAALEDLLGGLRLMQARDIIVSSNVPLRRDGTMYRGADSDQRLADPGVAVYWTARGKKGEPIPRVIPCDVWRTVRENVRALGLAVDCIRGLQRTGAGDILERAFVGFARLPETTGGGAPPEDCWTILGVRQGASRDQLNERMRALSRTEHPDRGGSSDRFSQITQAYHEALGVTP